MAPESAMAGLRSVWGLTSTLLCSAHQPPRHAVTRIDPHLNLFQSYRGPSQKAKAADDVLAAEDPQLEDNLTRALVVTLNNIADGPARAALLATLRWESEWGTFERGDMQVTAEGVDWPQPSRRKLAVLHGGRKLQRVAGAATNGKGRADAVLIGKGGLLAIETKIGDVVTNAQLQAHRATLGLESPTELSVRWVDVVKTIDGAVKQSKPHSTEAFLLAELKRYLEINGMGGLTHEHFAYFASTPETRETADELKVGIRRFLAAAAEDIRQALKSDWPVDVGSIRKADSAAYAALKPHSPTKQQLPHLSIAMDAAGLSVFANFETEPGFRPFVRGWSRDREQLLAVLGDLAKSAPLAWKSTEPIWRLHVMSRTFLAPRKYHYQTKLDVSLDMLTKLGPDADALVDESLRYASPAAAPEVKIGREYPASDVLTLDDISERLLSDAKQLVPVLGWAGFPIA